MPSGYFFNAFNDDRNQFGIPICYRYFKVSRRHHSVAGVSIVHPILITLDPNQFSFRFQGARILDADNNSEDSPHQIASYESYEQEKLLTIPVTEFRGTFVVKILEKVSTDHGNILSQAGAIYEIKRGENPLCFSNLKAIQIRRSEGYLNLSELLFDFLFDFFHSNVFLEDPNFEVLNAKLQGNAATNAIIGKLQYCYYCQLKIETQGKTSNSWQSDQINFEHKEAIKKWLAILRRKNAQGLIAPSTSWYESIEQEHGKVFFLNNGLSKTEKSLLSKTNKARRKKIISQLEGILSGQKAIEQIKKKIGLGDTNIAIALLLDLSKEKDYSDFHDVILLNSAEYNDYKKEKIHQTQSSETLTTIYNRINRNLLMVTNDIAEKINRDKALLNESLLNEQELLEKEAEDSIPWLINRYAISKAWGLKFYKVLRRFNRIFLITSWLVIVVLSGRAIFHFYYDHFFQKGNLLQNIFSIPLILISWFGAGLLFAIVLERAFELINVLILPPLRYLYLLFKRNVSKRLGVFKKNGTAVSENPKATMSVGGWWKNLLNYGTSTLSIVILIRPRILIGIVIAWILLINVQIANNLIRFDSFTARLLLMMGLLAIVLALMSSKLQGLFPHKGYRDGDISLKILSRAWFIIIIGVIYSFWTGIILMSFIIQARIAGLLSNESNATLNVDLSEFRWELPLIRDIHLIFDEELLIFGMSLALFLALLEFVTKVKDSLEETTGTS